MFQGTIPGPMRAIVRETARGWPRGPVYVPCCGNFTIERSLAGMGFELHSSNVSIYTSAVGRWLTRQPVGICLRDASADQLHWLADSLDDGVGTVATMMLGTRFLTCVGREGLWHERVVRSYRDQWKAKHAETVERLSGSDVELASYDVEDVRSWLQKVPRDVPVCSFPPFYGGGYEKLYEPLEAHFTWDAPQYEPLSDADVVDVLGAITDRPFWLTASNHDVPELHPYLRGVIKTTPRAAPFYVYASEARTRIVAPRQPIEPVKAPRLREGDELVGPLTLSLLKPGQFNALRSGTSTRGSHPARRTWLLRSGTAKGGCSVCSPWRPAPSRRTRRTCSRTSRSRRPTTPGCRSSSCSRPRAQRRSCCVSGRSHGGSGGWRPRRSATTRCR